MLNYAMPLRSASSHYHRMKIVKLPQFLPLSKRTQWLDCLLLWERVELRCACHGYTFQPQYHDGERELLGLWCGVMCGYMTVFTCDDLRVNTISTPPRKLVMWCCGNRVYWYTSDRVMVFTGDELPVNTVATPARKLVLLLGFGGALSCSCC